MKWVLGLIGFVLGGLMAEVSGAIVGVLLGVGVAAAWQGLFGGQRKAAGEAASAALEARVNALEREVSALRRQMRHLQGAAAAAPDAASAAVAQEAAKPPTTPPTSTGSAVIATAVSTAAAQAHLQALREARATVSTAAPDAAAAAPSAASPAVAPAAAAAPLPATPPAPATAATAATAAVKAAPEVPAIPLRERLPPWASQLVFGGNTIVKVGVLILFLGLAFLLRYAAERITTPPELRYAGVALLGAVLLGLGWRLRERKDHGGGSGYGLILQGAGIGVLYLTALAAMRLGALLAPEAAFAFLFAVALLSAVLAVAQNAPWLAYVAVAEGFAAPVLVSTGSGNALALFSYLAVLNLGIFAVAWFKAWRPLNLMGASGTFLLASAWAAKHYSDAHYPVAQGFLLFFFLLFTLIGVLFARRALALTDEPDERQSLSQRAAQALAGVGRVDSGLVFGVPLAAFGLQYLMVRGWEFGPALAALGFAAVYLLLGGALMRGGQRRFALLGEAYVIVSVLFGTLAIPLGLEGEWTGATWAIEAAGMYWLGRRQHRPYARAFALLVLGGAALQMLGALALDLRPHTPLLQGSVLGLLMLAGGAGVLSALAGGLAPQEARAWDRPGALAALWLAAAALAAVPWVLLVPLWASVATGGLALGVAGLRQRRALPTLGALCGTLHAVALAGFAGTLHRTSGGEQLDGGAASAVAALLLALSVLASVALPLRALLQAAGAAGQRPAWPLASSIGWAAGVVLLALSLLFAWPAETAARAWPWLGVAALALGLRLWQPGLMAAWALLQAAAAVAQWAYGPFLWAPERASFGFWIPLSLALAGLLGGHWLQRAAQQALAWPALRSLWLAWGLVAWAWLWWLSALLPELQRAVWQHSGNLRLWPAATVLGLLLSSALACGLARASSWRVLGQSTGFTLPTLSLLALAVVGAMGALPSAHGGWVAWPLALLWHGLLLRQQPRWLPARLLTALHVLGLWLFLLLAAREAQAALAGLGEPGSAWPLLGWAGVPALLLFALSRPAVARLWPVQAFETAYLRIACLPVAVYLLLWLWSANTQPGNAAPLPYLPLLNPLELGQGLVLLALLLWWRAARCGPSGSAWAAWLPQPLRWGALGATAFALYTGAVLRACHHLADVPWSEQTLFASTLTQAALSVAWALVGVALMVLGHRQARRAVWLAGAGLLAVVVLKLFLVELADTGGLYRIVSFIVVGLLLLLVGYFAPVPPAQRSEPAHA